MLSWNSMTLSHLRVGNANYFSNSGITGSRGLGKKDRLMQSTHGLQETQINVKNDSCSPVPEQCPEQYYLSLLHSCGSSSPSAAHHAAYLTKADVSAAISEFFGIVTSLVELMFSPLTL